MMYVHHFNKIEGKDRDCIYNIQCKNYRIENRCLHRTLWLTIVHAKMLYYILDAFLFFVFARDGSI